MAISLDNSLAKSLNNIPGARLSCLNRFVVLMTVVPVDLWLVFGVHAWLLILAISYMAGRVKILANGLIQTNWRLKY